MARPHARSPRRRPQRPPLRALFHADDGRRRGRGPRRCRRRPRLRGGDLPRWNGRAARRHPAPLAGRGSRPSRDDGRVPARACAESSRPRAVSLAADDRTAEPEPGRFDVCPVIALEEGRRARRNAAGGLARGPADGPDVARRLRGTLRRHPRALGGVRPAPDHVPHRHRERRRRRAPAGGEQPRARAAHPRLAPRDRAGGTYLPRQRSRVRPSRALDRARAMSGEAPEVGGRRLFAGGAELRCSTRLFGASRRASPAARA